MRGLLLAGVLTLLPVVTVAAQENDGPRHQGFWIGFGVGGGALLDAPDSRGGGAAYLRMGGTVNQQLLIGGEVSGWGRDVQGSTVSRANAVAIIQFYPAPERGIFLKGGLGFASQQVSAPLGGGTFTASEEGLGATFGAGIDFKVGGNIFITPNLDFLVQVVNDETDSLVLLTVGVGWH